MNTYAGFSIRLLHFYAEYAIDAQLIQHEEAEALAAKLMVVTHGEIKHPQPFLAT